MNTEMWIFVETITRIAETPRASFDIQKVKWSIIYL